MKAGAALCNDIRMHDSESASVGTVAGSDPRDLVDAVVRASRALVGVAARSLAGLEEEVTLAQYRMLVLLCSRGAQRVADLAQALGVNPSTATRMSDRLVAKRLARRQRTASDRRSVRVGVTASGRALVDEVTERRRQEIGRIVAAMTPARRELLVDALRAFADAAGEVPDQSWSAGWE
jgi:DNA-binding MarR family transcriptional regulator